jgi:glutathione S-transferase
LSPEAEKLLADTESKLIKSQWLGGSMPSIADKNACTALKDIMPNPLTHPNTFNWFGFVTKFPEEK